MIIKPLPSQARLRELLEYNPETGDFTWLERTLSEFSADMIGRRWNTRYARRKAGRIGANGYVMLAIDGTTYYGHRLAWKYQTGRDPDHVDHIDGVKHHNAFANLRDASPSENHQNKPVQSNNTSGAHGVSQTKNGRWRAYIKRDGKQVALGTFATSDEAVAARKAAEIEFGFHANHGRKSHA